MPARIRFLRPVWAIGNDGSRLKYDVDDVVEVEVINAKKHEFLDVQREKSFALLDRWFYEYVTDR